MVLLTFSFFSSLIFQFFMPLHGKMSRRVVVAGVGLVTPLGVGVENVWRRLVAGTTGMVSLEFDEHFSGQSCTVAAVVPEGTEPGCFNSANWTTAQWRQMSRSQAFAVQAAEEAVRNAAMNFSNVDPVRSGVVIGSGIADLDEIHKTGTLVDEGRSRKVSPYFVPKILTNMSAGHVAMRYGCNGPCHSPSTACATGLHAIGDAFNLIKLGHADFMLAGATESCISPIAFAGFSRLRALSTAFNSNPKLASRPFDKRRDGFVIGEGAAVLVLEELSHATSRGGQILAEIVGYGLSGDAHHLTAPDPEGQGAYLAMRSAVERIDDKVTYVNAHATSTPMGDAIECKAIDRLINDGTLDRDVKVSSTKGAVGHLLGAAGAVEAAFTILALDRKVIPPTANFESTEVPFVLDFVPSSCDVSTRSERRFYLCNSFGFGGTNASVCFASVE